MRVFYLIGAMALLAGCGSAAPTETAGSILQVRATPDSLFVTNHAAEPVWLFIVDTEELALMNFALCQTRMQCGPGLAPGATLRRSIASLDVSRNGVRHVFIGARTFRPVRPQVDSLLDLGSLTVDIPR